MKILEISREELYQQVWTTPMSKLAKKYGLSDQGLAKKCRKHQIPRPPVGYWVKLANGKNVAKPPLPEVTDPILQTVIFYQESQQKRAPNHALPPEQYPQIKKAEAFSVPAKISSYHPLVKASIEAFKERTTDRYGFLIPHYLKNTHLDIKATQGTIKRAHYLMHILITLFNSVSWSVKRDDSGYSKHGRTYVVIGDEEIEFQIKEKIRQIPHVLTEAEKKNRYAYPQKYDYLSTGKLSLQLSNTYIEGVRKAWVDDAKSPLTDKLPEIIQNLILAAEIIKQKRLEREEQYRKWEEERKHAEQLRKLQKIDIDRLNLLFEASERWNKIQKAQQFLRLVTQSIDKGEITPTDEIHAWIEWVTQKLSSLALPVILHETVNKHAKLGQMHFVYES